MDSFIKDSVLYRSDRTTAGESDYWQSPIETLASGKGDCEDYAIAKYATLRQLGFSEAQLKLAVVHNERDQGHAVTLAAARGDQDPLVMDNDRYFPVPLSQRGDLTPVFSVNTRGLQILDENWGATIPLRIALRQHSKIEDVMQRSASVLPEG